MSHLSDSTDSLLLESSKLRSGCCAGFGHAEDYWLHGGSCRSRNISNRSLVCKAICRILRLLELLTKTEGSDVVQMGHDMLPRWVDSLLFQVGNFGFHL